MVGVGLTVSDRCGQAAVWRRFLGVAQLAGIFWEFWELLRRRASVFGHRFSIFGWGGSGAVRSVGFLRPKCAPRAVAVRLLQAGSPATSSEVSGGLIGGVASIEAGLVWR